MIVGVRPLQAGNPPPAAQVADAWLPARSLPVTVAVKVPAADVLTGAESAAGNGPDVASLTVALTAAGNWVSSNDGGAPQVTTGGVVSRMIVVAVLVVPPAELALQRRVTLPSSVTIAGSQSELAAESGSATFHETA